MYKLSVKTQNGSTIGKKSLNEICVDVNRIKRLSMFCSYYMKKTVSRQTRNDTRIYKFSFV